MRLSVPAAHSFEEIGEALGITDVWARKIFLRAMRKLRRRAAKLRAGMRPPGPEVWYAFGLRIPSRRPALDERNDNR